MYNKEKWIKSLTLGEKDMESILIVNFQLRNFPSSIH